MENKPFWGICIAGVAAGAVNGLFGAGGGMLLVPLLTCLTQLEDDQIFPASVCIILPICITSLLAGFPESGIPWNTATPYLIGSAFGGVIAGLLDKKIPTLWLHRMLGALILWGGVRYLC